MEHRAEIDTDKELPATDSRRKIVSLVRTHFLNALSFRDFEIEHKVKVDDKLANGNGKVDYHDDEQEFTLKGCSLKRKVDKDTGGFYYSLKITVE